MWTMPSLGLPEIIKGNLHEDQIACAKLEEIDINIDCLDKEFLQGCEYEVHGVTFN